jgi:tetratricopeptide (TPR) repeat protein/tRNA A-37 threonylcarbamoyl transferase component Bud32
VSESGPPISSADGTLLGDSATLPGEGRQPTASGEEPARIGRFTVISRIGAGGMGVVYAAFDPKLDRKIAVKLVRRREHEEGSKSGGAQARLLREAQAMAKLSHPNVIQVYDVGTHEGQVYIAMEFVDGSTLERWLRERPRSWREIRDAFLRAGAGLAAAHAAGMVHRDFKPENVLVGHDGRVRVMDFGIVRATSEKSGQTGRFEALNEQQLEAALGPMTERGAVLGTPAYMAPEQVMSSSVDARADQFSFCVSLYEGLYGERPFRGKTLGALMFNIMQGKIAEAPKGSRVPSRVRRILTRGLSRRPADRFASMDELLAELSRDPARARRRWATGIATGMTIVGFAWGWSAFADDAGRECKADAATFDTTWAEARAQNVREAFDATGVPFAAASFASVSSQLDQYANQWTTMYEDACKATYDRGEESEELLHLRLDCLDQRRRETDAVVTVLAGADAKVVERAVIAVANLRPLDSCADATRLRDQVAPPEDSATQAEVQAIRAELARAVAKSGAGQYQAGLEIALAAKNRAEATGYRPLVAEALREQGSLESRLGKYEEAKRSLSEGYWLAMAVGHDEVMADAAIGLVSLVGARMAETDEARVWSRHGLAAIERIGELGRLREAGLRHNLGSALRHAGAYEESRENHQRALEIRERFLEPDHMAIAASLNNLGNVLANLDDLEGAQESFERAIEIFRKLNGDTHPMVAAGLNNLGQLLVLQGKYTQAREPVRHAADIWEQTLGPDHPNLAHPLNTLGVVLARLGDTQAGLDQLERALRINEKAFEAGHPQLATTHLNLAMVLLDAGRAKEARPHVEAALAGYASRKDGGGEEANTASELMARVLLDAGELEAAAEHAERAIAGFEKDRGPTHHDLASALVVRGQIELAAGDPKAAIADLERATTVAAGHPDRRVLALARFGLARALRADSQPERAEALAREALAGLEPRGMGTPHDLEQVRAFLDADG